MDDSRCDNHFALFLYPPGFIVCLQHQMDFISSNFPFFFFFLVLSFLLLLLFSRSFFSFTPCYLLNLSFIRPFFWYPSWSLPLIKRSLCMLQVDLRHVQQTEGSLEVLEGIDMSEFYKSVEWDILLVPVKYNEEFYECCPGEPYPDLTFNITMRRKTLFYTVNLVSTEWLPMNRQCHSPLFLFFFHPFSSSSFILYPFVLSSSSCLVQLSCSFILLPFGDNRSVLSFVFLFFLPSDSLFFCKQSFSSLFIYFFSFLPYS